MKLWSARIKGKLIPFAGARESVQVWVGRRFICAAPYYAACGRPAHKFGDPPVPVDIAERLYGPAIWRAVKRQHPTARLVRVNIQESSK